VRRRLELEGKAQGKVIMITDQTLTAVKNTLAAGFLTGQFIQQEISACFVSGHLCSWRRKETFKCNILETSVND
jgi:hypothetical protein